MEDKIGDIIQDIRKRCRMAMDGIVSSAMRTQGLDYKLNFGVPAPKIKEIAGRYTPNAPLAQKLWQENTRELKILATLLYPKDEFTIDIARLWINEIPNQEIREQLVFNILRYSQFTPILGMEWTNNEKSEIRTTGYWALGGYISKSASVDELNLEEMSYLKTDLESEDISQINAITLLLKNIGRISPNKANTILKELIFLRDSENQVKKEIFDSLLFDYQYRHGDAIKGIGLV